MSLSEVELIDFPGTPTAVVRGADVEVSELSKFMDSSYGALGKAIRDGYFRPAGPGFSRYDSEFARTVTLEVGFAVEEPLTDPIVIGDVVIVGSQLPAGRIATAKHRGAYDGLAASWGRLLEELADRGYAPGMPYWEAYDVAPVPGMLPEKLVTGLAVPVTRSAD